MRWGILHIPMPVLVYFFDAAIVASMFVLKVFDLCFSWMRWDERLLRSRLTDYKQHNYENYEPFPSVWSLLAAWVNPKRCKSRTPAFYRSTALENLILFGGMRVSEESEGWSEYCTIRSRSLPHFSPLSPVVSNIIFHERSIRTIVCKSRSRRWSHCCAFRLLLLLLLLLLLFRCCFSFFFLVCSEEGVVVFAVRLRVEERERDERGWKRSNRGFACVFLLSFYLSFFVCWWILVMNEEEWVCEYEYRLWWWTIEEEKKEERRCCLLLVCWWMNINININKKKKKTTSLEYSWIFSTMEWTWVNIKS